MAADGMDNPAFIGEDDSTNETKQDENQQQVTLDQDRKSMTESIPVENGHQRSFVSQQHVEAGRTSPEPHYRTETKIELPENNADRTEIKMNGVHGNGNNNDASFLNSSATSVQSNDTGKKEQIEAVNLELVSMRPYAGNNLQTKSQEACEVPADPYEEYFVPVNEHRKYIRGEKLYVTKDKRSRSSYWRRMVCWGCGLLVLLVAIILATLAATGVILTQEASEPLENLEQTKSRQFGDVRTAGSQEYVKDPPPSPPPATSSFPPWQTTDETMYNLFVPNALDGVLMLDQFPWDPELRSNTSRVYREVSAELEKQLRDMLQPASNETMIKVYRIMEDGEVGFRINYPPRTMPMETQQTFEDTLQKTGNMLGQYHLSRLEVKNLWDECQTGRLECAENCRYNYTSSTFVCYCEPGKTLDANGKSCIDENDLSNVEMEDETPEVHTEVVQDAVQPRSRGHGAHEPWHPDNWDHLDHNTEKIHYDSAHPHSDDGSTEPKSTHTDHDHGVRDESDPVHWMHDHSDHYTVEPKAEPTTEHSVEEHPAGEPEPVAGGEPSSEPKPVAEPEPAVVEPASEPEPSAEPEPVGVEHSNESEPPAEPEPASGVEHSHEPEPSVEPEPSAGVEDSSEPEPPVGVEHSSEPEPPAGVEHSSEPEPSAEPEPTATEPSSEPHPSVEPEPAGMEPSSEPQPSAEPEAAGTESSNEPKPSTELESSAEPEPSAEPPAEKEPSVEVKHSSEPKSEPPTVPEPTVEPEPTAEPEPSVGLEHSNEPSVGVQSSNEPKSEPAAEPEPTSEPEPSATSESPIEPEPAAEPEPTVVPEPSAEPEPSQEPEPAAEPAAEPETTVEPSTEPKPSTEAESSIEPKHSTETTSSPEPEPSVEPEVSAEPGTIVDQHSHVEHETNTEPVALAEPEPTSVPEPPSSEPKPVAEPQPVEEEPSAEPKASDEKESSTEPIPTAEPKPEPEPKPETEPVADPIPSNELESSTKSTMTEVEQLPSTTIKPEIPDEVESSTEQESMVPSVESGRSADANPANEVVHDVEHSTEPQDMESKTTEQMPSGTTDSSAESMTTNKVSVEPATELPDLMKTPESSTVRSESDSTNTLIPNVPSMEPESTTPMLSVETTMPSIEKTMDEVANNDAPLPVIPLITEEQTVMSDHSKTTVVPPVDTTIMSNEEQMTTTGSVVHDKEKSEQVTEANTPRDEEYTTISMNNGENMNPSSESSSVASSSSESVMPEVETTTGPQTTSDTMLENTTEINSVPETGNTETYTDVMSRNLGVVLPEMNETNVIDHMPTTLFPNLPKNFSHNIEPLIEPIKNSTEEEHIMIIPVDHGTAIQDPHSIIPELIPESIHPTNSSSVWISEVTTTENKLQSSTEKINVDLNHSTIHPEENIVPGDAGYAVRYEESLDHSTNHPLHPAIFPENTVEHVTEKSEVAYDKHVDDMSLFLPDVHRDKEVKKAPRLDKDEQDAPNPFEGHVEDVVTYKSLIETEEKTNETEPKDSLNDVHPEIHFVETPSQPEDENTMNTDVGNEVSRGFKGDTLNVLEMNDTESGIQNVLHPYDTNKPEDDQTMKSEGKTDLEEDEEALKVVPLEEELKDVDMAVKYSVNKDNAEVTESSSSKALTEAVVAANETTTSEKPEENAVEDQYNDINDDTLPKVYQPDDSKLHKKLKDEANKLVTNILDPEQGDEERLKSKVAYVDDKTKATTNDSEVAVTVTESTMDKHIEDARLTTQIPELPIEIQQDMSTTEKLESTTVAEDSRKENDSDHHASTEVTTTVPTTQVLVMETKTTAQVPILPEELQTTESDSPLTTSSMRPETSMNATNSENVDEEKFSASNQTDDVEHSDVQNNRTEDVASSVQHAGNNSGIDDASRMNKSEENVPTPSTTALEEITKNESMAENIMADAATTVVSHKQAFDGFSTTEDVRPVTEILEDDTQPMSFDFRTHLITTTPRVLLSDLDVGDLSEEDLRVIPLEKTLDLKKKSTDKKVVDKYKHKKEKELNLEEGESVPTEVPDPATVFSTEMPQPVDKIQDQDMPEADPKPAEEDSSSVPKLKITETTFNRTEADSEQTKGSTKKYPSFIPVSEEIIEPEPVTEPFGVIRNFYFHRSGGDFTTDNPAMVSELSAEGHTSMEPDKISVDSITENQTSTTESSDSSVVQDANPMTKNETVDALTSLTEAKTSDKPVESTSHIDVSFLNIPQNVVFSKCTAGQFQCINGTSRDGAYCVPLSAKCDSENDCSDGSDELNCKEEGCPENFQCNSGQCLKRDLVCNRIVDCDDGSDEKNCEEWKCQHDEFRCPSGRCIPGIWQCNGRPDCEDHRDEYNCAESCGNNEYLCPTEKWCIPLTWHCNGINECTDGEDEKLCDCGIDQFKCQAGGCIPEKLVCDGIEHCPDQSDEWNCLSMNLNMEKNATDAQKESDAENGGQELTDRTSLLKIRQFDGEHRLVCSDGWSEEFSDSYCQTLGFSGSETTDLQTWDKNQKILRLKANPNHRVPLVANLEQVEFCVSDKVVQVSCQEFSCGSHYGEGPTARLVGGTPASEGQWSSVALLKEQKQGAACTASILGPMHVIASYSCTHRYKQSNGWQLFTDKNLLKPHPVRSIIPYPQVKYNQFLYNNDMVLVELEQPLTFSRNVSAVCLPKDPIQPRQICVTVGWGFPVNGEVDLQKYLTFLPVPTYDSEKCNATSHYAGFITKNNICAGFTDTDKGPCYNDEGAPLMCVSESGGSARWEIQGLLSHHSRCSRGHPAIYSSVEPALSWLRNSVPALQTQS